MGTQAQCRAISSIAKMEQNSAHITLLNIQDCLGVDDRRHSCVPWEDTALCGVVIKSKKPFSMEERYDCYRCDAKLDELAEAEDIELRSTKNV